MKKKKETLEDIKDDPNFWKVESKIRYEQRKKKRKDEWIRW